MRFKNTILVCGLLMLVPCIQPKEETQRIELFGDYSYLRLNQVTPLKQPAASNGGGGGATVNLNRIWESRRVMGYWEYEFTKTVGAPIITPKGTIRPAPSIPSGNMFTYLFGPVVKGPLLADNAFW